MSNRKLARRYVVALGELAQESHMLDVVNQELTTIGELASTSAEFQYSISQASVAKDMQERVVRQLAEGRAHPLTLHFLLLLVHKRRLTYLPEIIAEMQAYTDEINHVQPVTVTSAIPLPAEQQAQVAKQLEQNLERQVRLQCATNPDLLGGMIIQVGDKAFDGSIAGHLRRLLSKVSQQSQAGVPLPLPQSLTSRQSPMVAQVVIVITAVPLAGELVKGLQAELEQKLGGHHHYVFDIKPEVLGGMIIQIGDKVFDGSIAGRLRHLMREINPEYDDHLLFDLTQVQPLGYEEMAEQVVTVTTAVHLEPELRENLEMRLQEKLGGPIRFVFKVRPDMLGGVRIHAGNKVYDGSVAKRLAKLMDEMSGEQLQKSLLSAFPGGLPPR